MGASPDDTAFEAAVATLLAHEGGLVDDPADPGGLTNHGISLRAYPRLGRQGIIDLTADEAKRLYHDDWWLRLGWWQLPPAIGAKVLDCGVDIGADAVHRALQRALRAVGRPVAEDGRLGPLTLALTEEADGAALLAALKSEIAAHYRLVAQARSGEARFIEGWLARAYG